MGELLVLTEDGARDGHATIMRLTEHMLRLLDSRCQTHRLGFEPRNDAAQRAVQANRWKSTAHRDAEAIIALVRTIATRLGRPDAVVLFHFDADEVWQRRERSDNLAKFRSIIVPRVRRLLLQSGIPRDDVEERMGRLLPLMPTYCLEAWLYQHTRVAVALCRRKYRGRDVYRFEAWARDRSLLDEVSRPKDQVCLRSRHNLECAGEGYPAPAVHAAGRSFHACVEHLRACPALLRLLRASRAG